MLVTDALYQLLKYIKRFSSHLVKCILHHYMNDLLLEELFVDLEDFYTFSVHNVCLDLSSLRDIPFSVYSCTISKITITVSKIDNIKVDITDMDLVLNVCNIPKLSNDPVSDMSDISDVDSIDDISQLPNISDISSQDEMEMSEKNIDDQIMAEGIEILENFIRNAVNGVSFSAKNTNVTFLTELGVSHKSKRHEMKLVIGSLEARNWSHVELSCMTFYVCAPQQTAYIPNISADLLDNGDLHVDCKNSNPVNISLCGDSYFIFTFFLQLFFENQRYITKKYLQNEVKMESIKSSSEIASHIFKSVQENINEILFEEKEMKRKRSEGGTEWVRTLMISHLDFNLDLHKGSDFQCSRMEADKITARVFDTCMSCDFQNDKIMLSIQKVQTTIGYISEPINVYMQSVDKYYWDLNVSVPDIFVRTSQYVVDSMLIIFNFNVVWNEYDLLYNTEENIRFRTIIIEPTHITARYFNSPIDYKKVLIGNWKYMLKLIPPCDITLTIPKMVQKYRLGWGEVIDEYMKEVVSTQKYKCVKKVIVGVTKRKVRKLLSI